MFTGTLLEHQIPAANKLCARKLMLLTHAQGTGKSVTSLAAAEKLLELKLIKRVLILAPAGIAWQWLDRIVEFTDHEDVTLVESKNKRSREYRAHTTVYSIVPYSVFRKDWEDILSLQFGLVIADEAQEFSNFRSKTFKLIKAFNSRYRWALTGTAVSNKLEDLYAIMQWVDPYYLPRWNRFEKLHIKRNPHTRQILGYKNLDSLNKYLLSKRMDRVTVDQVKVPKLIPDRKYVEKDNVIKATERDLLNALVNSDPDMSLYAFDGDISRAMHAARQALMSDDKIKMCKTLVSQILEESVDNRVVLYSHYKEPIKRLHAQFGNQASLFTGDDDAGAKRDAVTAFRNGDTRVLICSDAGKAGLDLPFANYTIHLDVPFSFGTIDQRSTRTQRVGSKFSSIVVIYLLVRDSLEQYYYQVTLNKGKLAKATIDGGDSDVTMRETSLTTYLNEIIRQH